MNTPVFLLGVIVFFVGLMLIFPHFVTLPLVVSLVGIVISGAGFAMKGRR